MTDPTEVRNPEHLPTDLPVPTDDGACAHLVGQPVPDLELPSTAGTARNLRAESMRRWVVVYAYPRTGRPGEEALGGQAAWDATPGARGCTPQSLGYRAAVDQLSSVGAVAFGLSTQTTEYQREAVARLGLPQELLSDHAQRLTSALRLPTFEVAGQVLLRRHTLFLRDGVVRRVRYPVFPPDGDAAEALAWLRAATGTTAGNGAGPADTPGVAGLDELLAPVRAAGLTVHTEVDPGVAALPAAVDGALYRIAQEAVTNVLRHARAATATVRVARDADGVRLEVRDDGSGAPAAAWDGHGDGHGIAGMRERVAALGGRLETGPATGGGWRVCAWLPVTG